MKRLPWPFVSLFALLLAGGCATIEPPDVFVTNLTPLPGGALEQRVQVDLRILNANDFDLPVYGLDIAMDINDRRFARGVSNTEFTVPPFGEATTSIVASTSVFDLVRQAYGLATGTGADVSYRIRGRAHLDRSAAAAIKGLPGTISFDRADVLQLPDAFRDPPLWPTGLEEIPTLNPEEAYP